jgi:hypothetical protein
MGIILLGGLVGLWFLSRRTPPGTVLAVAAAIYLLSWIPTDRIREIVVIMGAVRMLGFFGGILGIIDLMRKSSGKKESP